MVTGDFGGGDHTTHDSNEALKKHLEVLDKELGDIEVDFFENRPDFSPMKRLLETITNELREYGNDFGVLLREEPRHGGGLEGASEKIKNMKRALPKLKDAVAEAEALIVEGKGLFDSFKKQIESARQAVGVLEKL